MSGPASNSSDGNGRIHRRQAINGGARNRRKSEQLPLEHKAIACSSWSTLHVQRLTCAASGSLVVSAGFTYSSLLKPPRKRSTSSPPRLHLFANGCSENIPFARRSRAGVVVVHANNWLQTARRTESKGGRGGLLCCEGGIQRTRTRSTHPFVAQESGTWKSL